VLARLGKQVVDEVGAMSAMRHAGKNCVTAHINKLDFSRPVPGTQGGGARRGVMPADRPYSPTAAAVSRNRPSRISGSVGWYARSGISRTSSSIPTTICIVLAIVSAW